MNSTSTRRRPGGVNQRVMHSARTLHRLGEVDQHATQTRKHRRPEEANQPVTLTTQNSQDGDRYVIHTMMITLLGANLRAILTMMILLLLDAGLRAIHTMTTCRPGAADVPIHTTMMTAYRPGASLPEIPMTTPHHQEGETRSEIQATTLIEVAENVRRIPTMTDAGQHDLDTMTVMGPTGLAEDREMTTTKTEAIAQMVAIIGTIGIGADMTATGHTNRRNPRTLPKTRGCLRRVRNTGRQWNRMRSHCSHSLRKTCLTARDDDDDDDDDEDDDCINYTRCG